MVFDIYRNYSDPDLMRQLPAGINTCRDHQFFLDQSGGPCDVVVVLNWVEQEIVAECSEVWLLIQEPPYRKFFPWIFEQHSQYDRVYTPCSSVGGEKYISSHGALPWHIDRSYDSLSQMSHITKSKQLSWITSNKAFFPGHGARQGFLERLQKSSVPFDLFGRGYVEIADKAEALLPYRYSLAIENFSGPSYWTEKLADCFLTWTVPIYFGCTNIADYFPEGSYIWIDINAPDAIGQLGQVLQNDRYEDRLPALAEARKLVLEKHQIFPFLVEQLPASLGPRRRRIIKPFRRSFGAKLKSRLFGD